MLALFALSIRVAVRPKEMPFHFEAFSDDDWDLRWTPTYMRNYTGRWRIKRTGFPQVVEGEQMLYAETPNAYYGVSTRFPSPFSLRNRTLVLQFETRFRTILTCGAAYIKLFADDTFTPETLSNETHYAIMFGPDYCGAVADKVHFIMRTKNLLTGEIEENHLENPPAVENDELAHLYTLILRTDDTF